MGVLRRAEGSGRAGVSLVCVVLLLAPLAAMGAEQVEPEPPATAPLDGPAEGIPAGFTWIRPEEVAIRADGLARALEALPPDAAKRAAVQRIDRETAALVPDLERLLQNARAAVARSTPFVELEDLQHELAATAATLDAWEAPLGAEAKRIAEALDEIGRARAVWLATRERPETAAAGAVVRRRVEGALAALDAAVATLQPWRVQVLAVSDHVLDRRSAIAAALKRVEAATANEWTNLLVPGRVPLWQGGFADLVRSELPRVPDQILAYGRGTRAYIERDLRPVLLQIFVTVILMAVFRRLERDAPGAERRAARPYALACLLALLATPWFHPLSPQRFRQLLAIVALVPAGRIVLSASGPVLLTELVGLFALLLVDRIALALAPLPAVARASSLLATVIGLALAWWIVRRNRQTGGPAWMRRAMRAAFFGLAIALAAEIAGFDHLAALLGRGFVAGAVVGLFLYAATIGLEPIVVHALGTPLMRRSHLVMDDPATLRRRVDRTLWGLCALLWVVFVLKAVGLYSAAVAGLRALLDAGISVGALSISVGTVLAFALTLLAAMLLARTVTGVLEDDVYPRASLPRGVPVVLSTLVRYAVYSLGFLLALAAAGIQLSQLAILLGGLGVGIGLGLQDLVKNFAAGLTLLLERRVHPGDVVQVQGQEIFGRVQSIGMRATLVRGWNGSEFVVPNGDLIAGTITNWTLSDRLCRVDVPVGVAYGTDPERVLALLVDAARADPRLLADPPPQAIFTGFGESSLDFVLRAWTDQGIEEKLKLASDLALAVHRALDAAEISIPFPQRDLHLTSVAPAARAALADPERKA